MEIYGDFKTSLTRALDEIDSNWESYEGYIIAGSWPGENKKEMVDEALKVVGKAIADDIPLLGICFGHQIMAIFNGYELEKLPELNVGLHNNESYWHEYKVKDYPDTFRSGKIITTQFHPEYQSSKVKPHPVLVEFINLVKNP